MLTYLLPPPRLLILLFLPILFFNWVSMHRCAIQCYGRWQSIRRVVPRLKCFQILRIFWKHIDSSHKYRSWFVLVIPLACSGSDWSPNLDRTVNHTTKPSTVCLSVRDWWSQRESKWRWVRLKSETQNESDCVRVRAKLGVTLWGWARLRMRVSMNVRVSEKEWEFASESESEWEYERDSVRVSEKRWVWEWARLRVSKIESDSESVRVRTWVWEWESEVECGYESESVKVKVWEWVWVCESLSVRVSVRVRVRVKKVNYGKRLSRVRGNWGNGYYIGISVSFTVRQYDIQAQNDVILSWNRPIAYRKIDLL